MRPPASPELVERLHDEIVDRPDLRLGLQPRRPGGARGRAGCRPGGRAGRPRRGSSPASSRASSWLELEVVRARARSPRSRIAISGVRRSWLTARSTRGLDRVAAPQRLGLERLAREPLAVDRDAEQRRERRQQPPARRGAAAAAAPRAWIVPTRRPPASSGWRSRLGAGRASPSSIRACSTWSARAASAAIRSSSPLTLAALEQRGRDLGEQRRLGRPPPRARRQLADDDRGHDEHARARTSCASPAA